MLITLLAHARISGSGYLITHYVRLHRAIGLGYALKNLSVVRHFEAVGGLPSQQLCAAWKPVRLALFRRYTRAVLMSIQTLYGCRDDCELDEPSDQGHHRREGYGRDCARGRTGCGRDAVRCEFEITMGLRTGQLG